MAEKRQRADNETAVSEASTKGQKHRRLGAEDWKRVEEHLKNEFSLRKSSPFRQRAEARWMEVDRQVMMEPLTEVDVTGTGDQSWHTTVELGELSAASADMSADVMRIVFPSSRDWMQAHAEIGVPADARGNTKLDSKIQARIDGRLRALMIQQHKDFGFKQRYRLSLKEAFHHGGYVAEIDWGTQDEIYAGEKRRQKSAPVWIPHSMWNCYPDTSPSVMASDMVYDGSMFIKSYMPRHKAEALVKSGKDGWIGSQWKKVKKDEHVTAKDVRTKDVEVVKYWGDIVIPRTDGDIEYPSSKAVTMNGTLVYLAPTETPYPNIIYSTFERMDVRDPYGTSPIIKMSPTQSLSSESANQYMNGVMLATQPPIVYDGNDPDFVLNGGPVVSPGSKTSTKGQAAFKQIEVGNPQIALQGLQYFTSEMKDKLGQPLYRPTSDRQTATQVEKMQGDEEVDIVEFIDQQDASLTAFLNMQHHLNLQKMEPYAFYCGEMDDQDFIRMTRQDLPRSVVFEVVGSRGVIGERRRAQGMSVTTAFAASIPMFAELLDAPAILVKMYEDNGVKNAEQFLLENKDENPALLQAKLKQLTGIVQKMGAELEKEKTGNQAKMAKIEAEHQAKLTKIGTDHADRQAKMLLEFEAKMKDLSLSARRDLVKALSEKEDRAQNLFLHIMSRMEGRDPAAEHPDVPHLATREDLAGTHEALKAAFGEHSRSIGEALKAVVDSLERPRKVEVVRDHRGHPVAMRKGEHVYHVKRDHQGKIEAIEPRNE